MGSLDRRKADLQERFDREEAMLNTRLKRYEEFEAAGEEIPTDLVLEVSGLLHATARTRDFLKDLERESVVLLHEQIDREASAGFGPRKAREGDLPTEALIAPAGLEEKSIEEIIATLRNKHKWTWQQIVDWLVAKGIKRPKAGDTKWHTSGVYAIHKRGFKASVVS